MVSITSKSPYALKALVELALMEDAEPVPVAELARRRDLPAQFLEQLFGTLRRAGILVSQRGVKGGYRFARSPESVTVLELVELMDGPFGVEAEGIFREAVDAARERLAAQTVAGLADAERREAGAPMYHI